MSSTFHAMMASQQPGIGKAVVGKSEKEKAKEKKTGVKITAAIFFDGTGNNQSNVEKRLKDPEYMVSHWYEVTAKRESYEQYYSNVAILFFMQQKKIAGERIAPVYMEGIGTTNDGGDDRPGSGFGTGPTGIVNRVSLGIDRLKENIIKLYKPDREYIKELNVYVFGFSRGAAAARHFIARRYNSRNRRNNLCQALGVDPAVVTIKFAGLFDSVSSFDEVGDKAEDSRFAGKAVRHATYGGDDDFKNDVTELHLTLDDERLEKVVHFVAADEYRVNFSSTTIASARQRGIGCEFYLPGAHSDIGGGYAQLVEEERTYSGVLNTSTAFPFFEQAGWYGPEQLTRTTFTNRGSSEQTAVVGKRRVPLRYQYVALSMMLKLAAQSGLRFASPNADVQRGIKYVIGPGDPLAALKAQLEGFVLAHAAPGPAAHRPPLAPAAYRWLRQHYLHLSWSQDLGMELRLDQKTQLPIRLSLPG